jgi:lysophospholipase L1-like esterase
VNPLGLYVPLCCLLALGAAPAQAADAFQLLEGDRVVLLGNTLIEREQRYGYWETALTRRYPDKSITFRNLGWSGDTVFGEARAGFGGPADGFRHLKEHVLALKPTVLIIGYGANESFDGPAGLPRFVKGLETLLDALAPTKARVVLLSPLKQEDLGRPLPDPAAINKNLRLYADAIRDTAKKRGHLFVDLYDLLGKDAEKGHPLTDNGIHMTAYGYWRSAIVLERALGLPETVWSLEVKKEGKIVARGARVEKEKGGLLRLRVTDTMLPFPPQPEDGAPTPHFDPVKGRHLGVEGLAPGSYKLTIDGKTDFDRIREHVLRTWGIDIRTIDENKKADYSIPAKDWATGFSLPTAPEGEHAEQLRQTIVAKNRLYFYRWRPENETYLFGFRKHEQGQNAREIPQFDPLIAAKEKEIAKLRVPVAHIYELKAEKKP